MFLHAVLWTQVSFQLFLDVARSWFCAATHMPISWVRFTVTSPSNFYCFEHPPLLSTCLVKNVINEIFCLYSKGKNRGKFWNHVMDFYIHVELVNRHFFSMSRLEISPFATNIPLFLPFTPVLFQSDLPRTFFFFFTEFISRFPPCLNGECNNCEFVSLNFVS